MGAGTSTKGQHTEAAAAEAAAAAATTAANQRIAAEVSRRRAAYKKRKAEEEAKPPPDAAENEPPTEDAQAIVALEAFSGNPILPSPLGTRLSTPDFAHLESSDSLLVLPLLLHQPLVFCLHRHSSAWRLSWHPFSTCHSALAQAFLLSQIPPPIPPFLTYDRLVHLGDRNGIIYCALDVSPPVSTPPDQYPQDLDPEFLAQWTQGLLKGFQPLPSSKIKHNFVDLRLLMTGTNWEDRPTLEELSIAGNARAMLDWHHQAGFCGKCGTATVSIQPGRRRKCENDACQSTLYPRIDPVVLILVIDKLQDRVVLGRQSQFVPRLWSCLAGFMLLGESLEEAVRRLIRRVVSIEVGDIIYHSSQPWPVGPSYNSCQLMFSFFAMAKTFEIVVDKEELEDARWHSREQVRRALSSPEYKTQQEISASKIQQACSGEERRRKTRTSAKVAANDITSILIPGPFAIAYDMMSSWAADVPNTPAREV